MLSCGFVRFSSIVCTRGRLWGTYGTEGASGDDDLVIRWTLYAGDCPGVNAVMSVARFGAHAKPERQLNSGPLNFCPRVAIRHNKPPGMAHLNPVTSSEKLWFALHNCRSGLPQARSHQFTTLIMSHQYQFNVTMSCSGCSNAVLKALGRLQGVTKSDVDLKTQTVNVFTDESLGLGAVEAAIAKTGKKINDSKTIQ